MGEAADNGAKDPEKLLGAVRLRLGRFIVSQITGADPAFRVAVLPAKLEELIGKSLRAAKDNAIGAEVEA